MFTVIVGSFGPQYDPEFIGPQQERYVGPKVRDLSVGTSHASGKDEASVVLCHCQSRQEAEGLVAALKHQPSLWRGTFGPDPLFREDISQDDIARIIEGARDVMRSLQEQ